MRVILFLVGLSFLITSCIPTIPDDRALTYKQKKYFDLSNVQFYVEVDRYDGKLFIVPDIVFERVEKKIKSTFIDTVNTSKNKYQYKKKTVVDIKRDKIVLSNDTPGIYAVNQPSNKGQIAIDFGNDIILVFGYDVFDDWYELLDEQIINGAHYELKTPNVTAWVLTTDLEENWEEEIETNVDIDEKTTEGKVLK